MVNKTFIHEGIKMTIESSYLTVPYDNAVSAILIGIDRDVEKGQGVLKIS